VEVASENARLDTLQAAILLAKLPHLDDWVAIRREHAAVYEAALASAFELTAVTEGSEPAFTTFVLRHDDRDALIAHLAEHGFDAKVHYPLPIHRQRALEGIPTPELPHTEALVQRIVSLPVTPELEPSDRDRLIEVALDWSQAHA
jgi:dTDP-4-amino-4,6-dideoxygalactose transaminase